MSCQPVKGHTVWVLLIAVLADKHVTILERKSVILNSSVQRYKQKDHFFPVFIYFERHLGTKWNQEVSFAIRVIDSEKPQSSARFRHWHLKTKKYTCKTSSGTRTLSYILLQAEQLQQSSLLPQMPPHRFASSGDFSTAHFRQEKPGLVSSNSTCLSSCLSWRATWTRRSDPVSRGGRTLTVQY